MDKIHVNTAIFGDKDGLVDVEQEDGIVYNCFTDKAILSNSWNIINNIIVSAPSDTYKNRLEAKRFKVLPFLFSDAEYYIWVDGNHSPKPNMANLVELLDKNKSQIGLFRHNDRSCLYQEAIICSSYGVDTKSKLESQIRFYKKQGFLENEGLYALTCFIIKNTNQIKSLCVDWWSHINEFSSRDQISMPFLLKKHNITPTIIEGQIHGRGGYNDFFIDRLSHNW